MKRNLLFSILALAAAFAAGCSNSDDKAADGGNTGADGDTDADTDTDADSDGDTDVDAGADGGECVESPAVAGDCDEAAVKTPAALQVNEFDLDWSCVNPAQALLDSCASQPGLDCHFGARASAVIVVIGSQAAADAMSGVCGAFVLPADVDWASEKVVLAGLSDATCGTTLEHDLRTWTTDAGGVELELFIWDPGNPFDTNGSDCDSETPGSLAFVVGTAGQPETCLYKRPPCD
ncbi:MAG: hypothetical protein PHU25_06545 [Deltaproteobacteria bacterium]|nr:hypothetical protein [Deltaproteobacteria bacterium]